MYLAIITTVNKGAPEEPALVNAVPITTGMLDKEIEARLSGPLSKWLARKLLAAALRNLETDTKMQTVKLGLEHS